MAKPINEFGGWLTFFNIYQWFYFIGTIISIILVCIVLVISFFKLSNHTLVLLTDETFNALVLIYLIIIGFLFFNIIKLLKQKEAITPDKIVQMLIWNIIVTVVFVAIIWAFSCLLTSTNLDEAIKKLMIIKSRKESIKTGISAIIFTFIWWPYFKVSKRVLAFYGKNAGAKELPF